MVIFMVFAVRGGDYFPLSAKTEADTQSRIIGNAVEQAGGGFTGKCTLSKTQA